MLLVLIKSLVAWNLYHMEYMAEINLDCELLIELQNTLTFPMEIIVNNLSKCVKCVFCVLLDENP